MKNYQAVNGYNKTINQNLVEYLASQGFHPTKIKQHDHWYFSPFRNEKTPSFKVNNQLNVWSDFGLGTGSNLLSFISRFHNCTIGDFLKSHEDFSSTSNNHTHQKNSGYFQQDAALSVLKTILTAMNCPILIAKIVVVRKVFHH